MIGATTLTGQDELRRNLNAMANAMKREVMLEALTQAALPLQRRIQAIARRSPLAPHLADNIGISPAKSVDGVGLHEDEAAVAVGPTKDFFYGYFLEFQLGYPFMRPAWDEEGPKVVASIAGELWLALQRAAPRQSFGGRGR